MGGWVGGIECAYVCRIMLSYRNYPYAIHGSKME